MAAPRDEARAAAVLALFTGFAERAEVVPPLAELGERIGHPARIVRWEMLALEKAGAIIVERKGAGMAQQIRIILPGGVLASQWSPTWRPKGDSRTGTRRVMALLADAARAGAAVPSNAAIAGQLGMTSATVHSALNNLAAAGRIVIHRSGTSHSGNRQFEIDGHRTAWSPRSGTPAPPQPRSVPNIIAGGEPKRPDQPIVARRLPRCPYCELPAGHHLCRHGWNGMTTRAARRAIAFAAGLFSPRVAA